MAKPHKKKKIKKPVIKDFERKAAAASARLGLKYTCWVSLQVPSHDCELTAYVDFRRMRILPWDYRARSVKKAMAMQPYMWNVWWVLRMDAGLGTFYRDSEIPQREPQMLQHLLQPIAAAGQEITEKQRLEHITGRGAIFVPNEYQFSRDEIDQIFTLVSQHGTPVDELAPAS